MHVGKLLWISMFEHDVYDPCRIFGLSPYIWSPLHQLSQVHCVYFTCKCKSWEFESCMFEFSVLVMSLTQFGTCMCLICEIELHCVVIWCLYHGRICICEVWAKIMHLEPLNVELKRKNMFWIFQNFDSRSSGEIAAQAWNSCSQYFLQTWFPLERVSLRSSGEPCREAFRSSARVRDRA